MNPPTSFHTRRLILLLLSIFGLASCTFPEDSPRHDGEKLARLMVDRLRWMDEVAAVKQARSLPITDAPREAALLRAMETRGTEAGMPAMKTRAFFAGQIATAKHVQIRWFHEHPQPSRQNLLDLATTARPALDRIGAEMITCLARLRSADAAPAAVTRRARQHLLRAGYLAEDIQPGLDGLEEALNP